MVGEFFLNIGHTLLLQLSANPPTGNTSVICQPSHWQHFSYFVNPPTGSTSVILSTLLLATLQLSANPPTGNTSVILSTLPLATLQLSANPPTGNTSSATSFYQPKMGPYIIHRKKWSYSSILLSGHLFTCGWNSIPPLRQAWHQSRRTPRAQGCSRCTSCRTFLVYTG